MYVVTYWKIHLFVLLLHFINKQGSSIDLFFFMISFKFSFENANVVLDPNIFLWITASVADAVTVNSNGVKILLDNALIILFIKDNRVFSNGPKGIPKNPPSCSILWNWVVISFYLLMNHLQKLYEASKLVY